MIELKKLTDQVQRKRLANLVDRIELLYIKLASRDEQHNADQQLY